VNIGKLKARKRACTFLEGRGEDWQIIIMDARTALEDHPIGAYLEEFKYFHRSSNDRNITPTRSILSLIAQFI